MVSGPCIPAPLGAPLRYGSASHQESPRLRELCIRLFRSLLEAAVGSDKERMRSSARLFLVPLFLCMSDQADGVATVPVSQGDAGASWGISPAPAQPMGRGPAVPAGSWMHGQGRVHPLPYLVQQGSASWQWKPERAHPFGLPSLSLKARN